MKKIFILSFLLISVFFGNAQLRYLKANLQSSQEVPANASTATGVSIVRYNTTTRLLELWGDYQGLTTPANASHIHSPAAPGINAAVLINLTNTAGTSGTLTGSATLTPVQEADLLNGLMYVNVHTTTYSGGEIRGQLTTTTDGQTEFYNARLQGAQENPPNGSTASGSVNVLLDKTKDSVWLTGSYTGLVANASASHIHTGAPNINGPVKINLSFEASASGTLHVASPIIAADETEMVNGNTYVNVHNAIFPGGEIRGQLTQLSQVRFLRATLQASQEVPTNPSTATGIAIVKYNTATRLLELWGDYQGLTTAASASHIHSPAAPGINAAVLINLTNTAGTSGTLTGSSTLTLAQEADLFAGNMYVNVHTATYSGGEIRGQLGLTNAGETQYFVENLQGSQEVPGNASTATGSVTVILDKLSNQVFLTGSFTGLTTPANAAHIHQERAGVNGPVVVNLNFTAATAGTLNATATVTQAFANEMINGNTYVNIHNSSFTGGEIRGQLANLVLPVLLKYFNGYKEQNKVTLIWETEQQINLDRYEIEQQNPVTGKWETKSSVSATGGSSKVKLKLTDVPTNYNSTYVIYRLKMIDKDGKFTYSPTLKINFKESKAELMVLGNPILNGQLTYMLTGLSANIKTEVAVMDYSGKTVLKTFGQGLLNNKLNVSRLSSGMYKLVVKFDDITLQQNFIK